MTAVIPRAPHPVAQWPTSTPPARTVSCVCRQAMTLVMRGYGAGSALLWTCVHEGDGAWHARRVVAA